jgi:hypothetical protein
MQIQAGIADDRLRPAYQKLFIATGDVTRSNELMQIALDASAATGKDLDTVTQAMAKSLAGNDAALAKLIPSLRDSKDPITEMGLAFKGASTEAANLDPYQRMQIIFGEIQEKLGTALLPILDDFAQWMMSPPGQKTLQEIADAASNVLKELTKTANWAIANKDWLLPLVAGVGVFSTTVKAIGTITTAVAALKTGIVAVNTAASAGILGGLAATAGLLGAGAAGSAYGGYLNQKALTEQNKILFAGGTKEDPFAGLGKIGANGYIPKATGTTGMPAPGARGAVTINVNNPNANASDIIKKLDDYYKATGARLQ